MNTAHFLKACRIQSCKCVNWRKSLLTHLICTLPIASMCWRLPNTKERNKKNGPELDDHSQASKQHALETKQFRTISVNIYSTVLCVCQIHYHHKLPLNGWFLNYLPNNCITNKFVCSKHLNQTREKLFQNTITFPAVSPSPRWRVRLRDASDQNANRQPASQPHKRIIYFSRIKGFTGKRLWKVIQWIERTWNVFPAH